MNTCPNCKHEELPGAIFCSECGAQLITIYGGTETSKIIVDASEMQTAPMTMPTGQGNSWISLQFVDTGELLPVIESNEFTIGRGSDNQPIMPDVDLTPYKAYENGVSRLHAVIRRSEKRVILMDLGSSNGTYINGGRISPNVHQVLHQGDLISIGKLKFQVILT